MITRSHWPLVLPAFWFCFYSLTILKHSVPPNCSILYLWNLLIWKTGEVICPTPGPPTTWHVTITQVALKWPVHGSCPWQARPSGNQHLYFQKLCPEVYSDSRVEDYCQLLMWLPPPGTMSSDQNVKVQRQLWAAKWFVPSEKRQERHLACVCVTFPRSSPL